MTFGEWLRKGLQTKGISNAELARRVDISGTYIGNLLRDYSPNMTSNRAPRPSEAVVEAIAKALGEPLNDARLAAGYAPVAEKGKGGGFYSGLEKVPPEHRDRLNRQIQALIDSYVPGEGDTDYIDE